MGKKKGKKPVVLENETLINSIPEDVDTFQVSRADIKRKKKDAK